MFSSWFRNIEIEPFLIVFAAAYLHKSARFGQDMNQVAAGVFKPLIDALTYHISLLKVINELQSETADTTSNTSNIAIQVEINLSG